MLSTELNEAAIEFGRALSQAPIVVAYRAANDALDADPAAQAVVAELRDHLTTLSRTQRAGLTPSEVQLERLRLCQAAVRANETVMAHLRATNDLKAFLPSVALEVSAAVGADYASMIAPSSC